LGPPEGEEEHVGIAGHEVVGAAHDIGHQHRPHISLRQAGAGEHGTRDLIDLAHCGIAHGHALALEIRDLEHSGVLANEERRAQSLGSPDQAQVLEPAVEPVLRLHDVDQAYFGLAARDQWNDDVTAGSRLHQDVEAGLLLHRLGNGRRDDVAQRARRQRGEAVGLRGSGRGRERQCGKPKGKPGQPTDRYGHGFCSSRLRSLHSAGGNSMRGPIASERLERRSETAAAAFPPHSRRREIT
jgi:hypothetical protein